MAALGSTTGMISTSMNGRTAERSSGAAGRGIGTLRAGWRRRLGWPGPGEAAVHRHPSRLSRAQAPAHGRLGKSHRHRAGSVTACRRRSHQRRRGSAAVHLAAHREHPPPACVRQTRRIEPGRPRRRRASLDRVMLSPPAASTLDGMQSRRLQTSTNGRATVDHAATMRNTYERINAGDIAEFGHMVADDFVEHQGGPGFLPPRKGRSTSSVPCSTPSLTCA
jgi:hypothetical protein